MRWLRLMRFGVLAGTCIVCGAGSVGALTDAELYEKGRAAYIQDELVKAAMWLFAYVQRDPVRMETSPEHRAQVEQVLEFCQEEPARREQMLRGDLETCESLRMELADRCEEEVVVAGTRSYMIQRPRLEPLPGAASPTYPLFCRGAAGLELSWKPRAEVLGEENVLVLEFRRGEEGVKDRLERLGPGECSWGDRGVRASEPYRLCYPVDPQDFRVTWALPGREIRELGSGVPAALRDLGTSQTVSEFQVYNNRAGCLVAVEPRRMQVLPIRVPIPPQDLPLRREVPVPRDLRLR